MSSALGAACLSCEPTHALAPVRDSVTCGPYKHVIGWSLALQLTFANELIHVEESRVLPLGNSHPTDANPRGGRESQHPRATPVLQRRHIPFLLSAFFFTFSSAASRSSVFLRSFLCSMDSKPRSCLSEALRVKGSCHTVARRSVASPATSPGSDVSSAAAGSTASELGSSGPARKLQRYGLAPSRTTTPESAALAYSISRSQPLLVTAGSAVLKFLFSRHQAPSLTAGPASKPRSGLRLLLSSAIRGLQQPAATAGSGVALRADLLSTLS